MNKTNLSIIKIHGNQSNHFIKCLQIRKSVFVEEQHVPEEIEADEHDASAYHYLVLLNENSNRQTPIATARWRITDKGIKIERFAVLKPYRNNGIGSNILQQVLNDIKPLNKEIYLHAQESAVNFYQKHNFIIIDEPFYEANIKHFKMILKN